MSDNKNSSIRTSSMKDLFKFFEENLGRKLTSEDVAVINLEKIDPSPMSGAFNFEVGTIQDLKNKTSDINVLDNVVVESNAAISSVKKNKPR